MCTCLENYPTKVLSALNLNKCLLRLTQPGVENSNRFFGSIILSPTRAFLRDGDSTFILYSFLTGGRWPGFKRAPALGF